jgi:ribosomal protection tetracycline resistance protein
VARSLLNLGILAHVDAGKTTLTERLLYAAGAIDAPGSVDAGTTRTDTLELERRRGITIKAGVVSFAVGETTVSLIDTPGHPDFIAEVERALAVLDGVVLVVSAVEGVQPQTRVLWRALRRLELPTLFFVNKTDRRGADVARVVAAIRERLTPAAALLDEGLLAELAERDDELLAAYVNGTAVPERRLRPALAAQTRAGAFYPVFAGSALRGDGVDELLQGIGELLPPAAGDPGAPLSASVFKIERGPAGEKVAYARLHEGTLRVRDRFGERRVTGLAAFGRDGEGRRLAAEAGEIAKLRGLAELRIGDVLGEPPPRRAGSGFAPPTLETAVAPRDPRDAHALSVALGELAEQDPLIGLRRNGGVLAVSLYGEVQQEVLEATLADDYGLTVEFRDSTILHVERPRAAGEAVEVLNTASNPFSATVGLRIEPAPENTGVEFRLGVATRSLPLYVFRSRELFAESMSRYVRDALRDGRYGWPVTDCVVTMIACEYSSADGPPSKRGPLSMPGDYEGLTQLVLRQALERSGTVVCEPILHVTVELPGDALGSVLRLLARLGAAGEPPAVRGTLASVETLVPAARIKELRRQLPGLTGGEGVVETSFAGYRPVEGEGPRRSGAATAESP